MRTRVVAWFAALGLSAGIVIAQGTITDGNVSFARTGTPFDASPTADLTGVAAQDPLFELGWWFRLSFESLEVPLPVPASQSYVGDTSTIVRNGVGTFNLLDFVEEAVVTDAGSAGSADGGWVDFSLQVTNNDDATVSVEVYAMADLDVAGAGNDSATIFLSPRYMRLTDPSGTRAELWGVGATSYLVRPWGDNDLGAVLSDGSGTTFDNTGLPFGPGDFTGGFQWTLSLAAGQSRTIQFRVAVNASLFCDDSGGNSIFCQDFDQKPLLGMSDIVPQTCAGCPGQSSAGCFCDSLCLIIGDCCADACLVCGRCPPY